MNRKTIYTGAAAALALLLTACDIPGTNPEGIPGYDRKAAVQVLIGPGQQSRTVAPGVELAGTDWRLLGGKSGDTKTLLAEFSEGNGTVYLEPGTWGFILEGYKDGGLILSGNITKQTISLDSPNTLKFTVAPVLEGAGTIAITIELPDGSGITEARIFRDGAQLTPSVTPDNNRIVLEYPAHPAGDYYFSVRLYKDADLYGVVSEVVQVRDNLVSAMTYTLTWEDLNRVYVITYHLEDDKTETDYYRHTDAAVTLTDPSRQGYVFRGWYATAYFSGEPVTAIPAGSTGDKTFYAKWVAQYTVTFDAQGGSVDQAPITVDAGGYVTHLPTATMRGYTFGGWFTQPNGGGDQFTTNTPVNEDLSLYALWIATGANLRDVGVYIGLISFASDATDLTNDTPIFLDSSGRNSLINKINSEYVRSSQGGTALFYGVHKALANLTSISTYPDKLDSVNVVTFTDGLDFTSSFESFRDPIEEQTFDTETEYATYVDDQIDSRTIDGKPITAYSVGIRGSDVTNIPQFQSNLEKIAGDGKSYEMTGFDNLQATFTDIAGSLQVQVVHSNTTMNMEISMLTTGTKIRLTFDVSGTASSSAEGSSRFIEGTVTRTGSGSGLTYTLTDITYGGGLGSTQDAGPITGTINGSEVNFAFTGMSGYDPATDESLAKQWIMTSGTSDWQINSEYSLSGATDVQIEERSAIIYLVLDASTSLDTTQIDQIRSAVIEFINTLYNQLNQ